MLLPSAGISVLWWLYNDHRLTDNNTSTKEGNEEEEVTRVNVQGLLVYAIAATVFTVSIQTG